MIIVLDKKSTLCMLREHRQDHITEYNNQMKGWQKAMDTFAEELTAWKDKMIETPGLQRPEEPKKPVSFVKDYDRYIQMIEANVTDTIQIADHEFSEIVNDDFHWRGTFFANSLCYSR